MRLIVLAEGHDVGGGDVAKGAHAEKEVQNVPVVNLVRLVEVDRVGILV